MKKVKKLLVSKEITVEDCREKYPQAFEKVYHVLQKRGLV
jgi:hypothetical protein